MNRNFSKIGANVKGALKFLAPLAAVLAVSACNGSGVSNVPAASSYVPQWQAKHLAHRACPDAPPGYAVCDVLIEDRGGVTSQSNPYGWAPADFQAAYNLPSKANGKGQLVAIVDAYDNPDVAGDLAVYRKQYGLGTADFHKYNQKGQQKNYPQGSPSWGVEIDLDVQMVSAVCPNCKIALIESTTSNSPDMQTAEAEAVKLGAHIVSNSWICYSYSCTIDPKYFDKPGVMYLAGSGDAGYGIIGPPMSLSTVIAVGGTVLSKNGSQYSEQVWDGAGAGCTSQINKPKWQHDPSCTYRTTADVSAVAYGVAEYDTFSGGGWFTVGGTSVATPLIAGVFGLAGNAKSRPDGGQAFWQLSKKQLKKSLHYISAGSDGSCGGSYLCTAGTKQFGNYAGPIGWGTPNGIGAF
jgi:subtilase family protein